MSILFNSDGGCGSLFHNEPPITPDQLCNVVNQLAGTQVTIFVQCVNDGDDQFFYPTKVAQIADGRYVKDGKFEEENFRKMQLNIRSLLDRGSDPLNIWIERTHELGMLFWASQRMNDIHKDWVDRWPSIRSEWEKQNTHLLIGKDFPERYAKRVNYSGELFTWAMNYAEEEVRNRKFSIIEEVCSGYDVDGYEMDFLSHPYFFRKGHEIRGSGIMNDFVRKVRGRLEEIGTERGKKITLCARVLPNFRECEEACLDVMTWIKEGLIDVLQPMTRGYLDMNADVASFVGAVEGTGIEIAGGLEMYVRDYAGGYTGRADVEMMRAAASGYWQEGVDSIYLFNFDGHAKNFFHPATAEELQILKEIGGPDTIANRDKHYYVTRDMSGLTPEEGGDKMLPVDLEGKGASGRFRFTVGDDVKGAEKEGTLEPVLRLSFNRSPEDLLHVELNDRDPGDGAIKRRLFCSTLTFAGPPVIQGKNELTISLKTPGKIRIEAIELFVRYVS